MIMKKKAKFFRDAAWAQLKGNWGHAVLFTLVFFLINIALGTFGVISELISAGVISEVVDSLWLELLDILLSLFVVLPLSYGLSVSFLEYVRTNDLNIGRMFDAFKANYGRVIGVSLLEGLVCLLGLVVLIVPGVIFAIAVSMSFYILKDNPELGVIDVIKRSIQMMKGHKMEYFCLGLSFIGWIILGILTLGIGFMWITPYICTADAHFYEYVKEDYESRVNG
jgi:uncharacterized membrane protein